MAKVFFNRIFKSFVVAYSVCAVGTYAFAANELAQSFTLDGQLMLAGTTTVLADSAAVLKIDILDPSKTCVLYEEQQTVNTSSSDGYFSVQVGSVTGASKRTGSDPGLTMVQVFQNTSAVAATSASGATCSGNTYTPSADAVRYFRITVTPSSTNVADVLSPDTTIDAAPMAMVAQTLQGYQATDFLAKAGLPTCSSGTFLTYDGTNMTCAAVSGSSGGTVTSITAGTGLTGGTITASGTLALATSGATAGTYGSASAVPVVTVDTYGRVTNVTTASISSSPSGSASGDLSGTYPGPTVNGLSGTALSISSLTSGQYLKYNGTNWINSTLSVSDSNITYGSEAANTFFAAPNGSAGTPTFRTMVAADLPTVPYTRGGTGLTATPANGQIAIGNGSGYTLGTLTAGTGVSITNAAGSVTIAATGGTGTVTSVTGTAPVSVATGTSTPVVSISQATTSTDGYLSSTDWNTFNSKMGSSLASGDIFVGNASGAAVPVAMSGDATLSNTGVLTLASVATSGTYEKVIVNAKGLVTSGSSLGSSDITTALGYTPVNKAGDSMSGNLTFASGKATVYTDSGSNTVTVEAPTTITNSYVLKLPTAVASAAGQVLTSDTSGNLSWSTPSTTATSYSGILPIANGGTNSSTALTNNQVMISSGGKIVEGGAMTNGQLMIGSGSGAPIPATLTAGSGITITNAANSITIASSGSSMPALPSADIFVGNSSGGAAAVAMSGDIGITNAGATTVNKIQGTAVSSTTPTAGQVLRYTSGTGWVPDFVSMADLRSTITGATALTSCGANQTLTWTAAADNLTCTSIAISDSQITYGSETANTVLAAPNGSAGVPTYRALVAADLPTVPYTRGGTGLTATPANGQIPIGNGAGYTLSTLTAGTGVTITNAAGGITIAASGSGGTVTSVTGTAPISVATGTSTPVVSISQATTSSDGYLSSTDWNTFNSKLTSSLASGDIFVGNSSGAAVPVVMSGDATLSSAGALTLATVATAGTYEKVIVNAKGLVTSGSSLGSSDITTALGYTPVNKAGDSMSGNLTFASGVGTVYTAANANTVTMEAPASVTTSYVLKLPAAVASSAGQVLTSDTSGNLSWTTPATGSVTSVGLSLPSIFTVTNSPVTSSGTLTATLASETANTFLAAPNGSAGTPTFRTIASADLPTIPVSGGGTGLTAGTSGGIPYYASTSTMASSALLTQYGVVYGGGAGAAPAATAVGTTGYVLTSNGGTSAPSFQQVSLSAGVTGTLPIANGGTSATTAAAARTALGAAASSANSDITSTADLTSISSSTSAITIAPTGNLNLSPSTAVVSSAVIEAPLGTAAAPSYTNSTNPNTGMYFPTSTSLEFSTAGSSAMTILSSGYVGIGTTSPVASLQVSDGGVATGVPVFTASSSQTQTAAYTAAQINAGAKSSTASIAKIGLSVQSTGAWTGTSATNLGLDVNVSGGTSNYAASFTGGSVGIGVTYPSTLLQVSTADTSLYTPSSSTLTVPWTSSGAVAMINNTSWTTGSAAYLDLASMTSTDGTEHAYIGAVSSTSTSYAPALVFGARTALTAYSERMRIDTTGNVGIGTTSPYGSLQVTNATGFDPWGMPLDSVAVGYVAHTNWNGSGIAMSGGTSGSDLGLIGYNANNIYFGQISGTGAASQQMIINSSGYVGIGTTSPVGLLDVHQSAVGVPLLVEGTDPRVALVDTSVTPFTTTGSPEWFIDNDDDLFRIARQPNLSTGGVAMLSITNVGNATLVGTLTQNSDIRLKENIETIPESLKKISEIRGVTYYWKDRKNRDNNRQMGVIAQEVEKVFPEAVTEDKKTGTKSVAYTSLVAPLIEAVKSLFMAQTQQGRDISSLQGENKILKEEVTALKVLVCKDHPQEDICKH